MFVLIDVRAIISKHYETLRLDSPIKFILLLFVIIPILISIFLVYLDKMLTQNSVNDLITAYTLFTGFLLSIIFVLFDIEGKLKRTTYRYLEKKDLLHHLYANTLYALLISMITLVILILVAITELWTKVAQNLPAGVGNSSCCQGLSQSQFTFQWQDGLLILISFIIYFLITHFIMTLFMILKRLYYLVYDPTRNEADEEEIQPNDTPHT